MYVCICRQVTDTQIRKAIAEGATNLKQLCNSLPIGTQCGRCCKTAREILQQECQPPQKAYCTSNAPDLLSETASQIA